MFSKSNLLATITGFLVLNILGWIFYGHLAENLFDSHTLVPEIKKEMSGMGAAYISLGCLIISFVMSTIYGKWARGHHSAKDGFQYGALVGLMMGFGVGIIMYGTSNFMDAAGHIIDGIFNIVYYGIAGMAIAMVYKATSKAE